MSSSKYLYGCTVTTKVEEHCPIPPTNSQPTHMQLIAKYQTIPSAIQLYRTIQIFCL